MILTAVAQAQAQGARLGAACALAGISARTVERWRSEPEGEDDRHGPHHQPGNALTAAEQTKALAIMSSPEYAGCSPKQIVPQLADQGIYVASESTLYRLRRWVALCAPRRSTVRCQTTRASTVHRATGPNQVWSWDITYLPTVIRGCFLYLYLVVDVWSRRIVGWEVHERETADHAATLIRRICDESGVDPKGIVLHADNGKPMRGSTMVATLQWLGMIPSFSRPHVCNDNPYSEALFRTLKQTPAYPQLPFANLDEARAWVARFVEWYNGEHRHSSIRFVTPDQRHFGLEQDILASRRALYDRARRRHPERWSGSARDWTPVGLVELNPEPQQREAA